jgi:hypothetical protein
VSELEWELRLKNEVSAAAKQAGLDIRQFSESVREAQLRLDGLAKAEKNEGSEARNAKEAHESFFGDMLSADLVAEGIEMVAEKVADLALEFGKAVIDAADFGYEANLSLTAITGSAETAKETMEYARAFANGAGENIEKVTSLYEQLSATGLRGENLTAAAAAAKDLSIASHTSFDSTSQLFRMIGSEGGMGPRAVRTLREFPNLLKQMKEDLNINAGGQKGMEELGKKMESLGLHGATGIAFFEQEIKRVANEDQLGDLSYKAGLSFDGFATKISNEFKEALEEIASDPEFDVIRGDLDNIAKFFKPGAEGGKEMKKALAEAIEPVLEGIKYIEAHPEALKDFFHEAMEDAKGIGTIIKGISEFAHFASRDIVFDLNHGLHMEEHESGHGSAEEFFGGTKQEREYEQTQRENDDLELQRAYEEHKRGVAAGEYGESEGGVSVPPQDSGGTVNRTGMVTVHEGEEIVPAVVTRGGGNTYNSSVGGHTFMFNVSLPAGSVGAMDEQQLALHLSALIPGQITNALEQMMQQKGGA